MRSSFGLAASPIILFGQRFVTLSFSSLLRPASRCSVMSISYGLCQSRPYACACALRPVGQPAPDGVGRCAPALLEGDCPLPERQIFGAWLRLLLDSASVVRALEYDEACIICVE